MSRKRRSRKINPRQPIDRCERGVWIDTEGSITFPNAKTYAYVIEVSQDEKEVLEDYCEGARRDGVKCTVVYSPTKRVYTARVFNVVSVAKEISLTQHCIRTKKKRQKIEEFKKSLLRPRYIWVGFPPKRRLVPYVKPAIKEARKILGI